MEPKDPMDELLRFKKNFEQAFQFNPFKLLPIIFILLLVIGGMTSFYTVQPDEEAVIIRLGKYHGTFPPGLHFKIPLGVDRLIVVKTTKIHQQEFGFRTKDTSQRRTAYSRGNFNKESLMLTGDLNVADVEWVVQYKIADPYKYLFQARNPRQNIRDVSESIMRRVVGDELVNDVLTTKRAEIALKAKELMQEVVNRYDIGIYITAVKMQDVNPPEVVKASFNEVNEAKQEQEKLINNAEESYNKVIPEARGQAEEVISKAKGKAESIINRAKGDSEKFRQIAIEYKKAPDITKKRLYLESMEKILKNNKELTIVDSELSGVLPILNLREKQ